MDLDGDTLASADLAKGVDIISVGRTHDELRPGEAVLSTFSGPDSTLLPGLSNLHICADKCDCISDLSRILSLSVELMDLSRVRGLLRELTSPLEFEKLWLFFRLSLEFLNSKFMLMGYCGCLLLLILSLS